MFDFISEPDKVLLMENIKLLMDADGKISEQEQQLEKEIKRNLNLN